ncbi:MAG: hypothetical protein LBV39_01600 [Bacteroidales bacterium]|jgi:opacity protein-like surface antigen|nr:hypothetical protein [Bacteroidales bacterium]
MKKVLLFLILPHLLMAGLFAQEQDERLSGTFLKFKPRYAGTSVNSGFMFTSGYGSAFYVAPQVNFQLTPRFYLHSGISAVQYSLTPSQVEGTFRNRTQTGIYLYTAGTYLVNEKWSVNGSVMKNVTPQSAPPSRYSLPTEAMHVGVDYHVTPNVTIGAKIGYSKGDNSFNHTGFPY